MRHRPSIPLRRLFRELVCVLLLGGACSNPAPPATEQPAPPKAATSTPPPVASPAPSAGAPEKSEEPVEPRRLSFTIVKVYPGQDATHAPPWHKPDGDWTFLDAQTSVGTPFVVGLPPRAPRSPKSMGYGSAVLAVPDRDTGARFVAELATAFGVPAPAKGTKAPLHEATFTTSILTENAMRDPSGDFGGVGGGWVSQRWTSDADDSAQINFNYNLTARQGELVSKSSTVAVVGQLSHALRDGYEAK